ncbi:MAG: signal peptidase II [Candidatus Woesearchaeota archaeon]|jgi:signal peptidase II
MNFSDCIKKVEMQIVSIGVGLVILDQLIKSNIHNPVLNFGASFGIMQNERTILLVAAILIMGILGYMYYKTNDLSLRVSYTLIFFGALSNFIDRVFLGYVIDYIPMPFFPTFPTFNIADSMICVGIGFLILYEFVLRKKLNKK